MSDALDSRGEILRRLLLEEPDPLAALARSELATDASARAELEELLDAQRRVQGLADDEREALRQSTPGSAEHRAEERVLERLRAHVAAQAPPLRERKFRMNWVLLLAAAFALFLGWRFLDGDASESDPDTRLGGSAKLEVTLATYEEITWSGKLPVGSHFVVRVLDGTAGGGGDEVASSPPLVKTRWTPAEADRVSWPDEIRIHVELWGPGPNDLYGSSPEVRARRTP